MFKSLVFAVALAASGSMLTTDTAFAGHPHCRGGNGYGGGYGGGGYYSNYAPAYVVPYAPYQSFGSPYIGPNRHGYGYPGYNAYRPSVGIGIGGYPYGLGGGYGGYRGGSGFSLYIGR